MITRPLLLALCVTGLCHLIHAQQDYEIRLVGDNVIPRGGILEVFFNNQWGTVCMDGFDVKAAAVVCYQLGYIRSASITADSGDTNIGATGITTQTPTHFTGLKCAGNENRFDECQRSQPPVIQCTGGKFAAVYCLGALRSTIPPTTTTPIPTTTTTLPPRICNNPSTNVQLVNGSNPAVGRVQIRQSANSPWGEICDYLWDEREAQVICRMLCYNPANARAYLGDTFGAPSGDYLLKNLMCTGTESITFIFVNDSPCISLADIFTCRRLESINNNCTPKEAASLSCLEQAPTPPPLPTPVIECSGLSETIKAVFSKTFEPDLQPQYLSLTNQSQTTSCGYTTGENSTHVFITVPFYACGSVRNYNFSHIIYSSMIRHAIPPKSSVISRTEVYNINVSCAMGRNGDPENEVDPKGRTAPPQQGEGHPNLQLIRFDSSSFDNKLATPEINLGELAYFAIQLLTNDDFLKVVLQQCYATPNASADSQPQYFLIYDKCANESSVQFYPLNETFYGFSFQSFKFFGDGTSVVYLHCKGIVCGLDEFYPRCDRTCGTGIGTSKKKRSLEEVDNVDETLEQLSVFFPLRIKRSFLSLPYEVDVDSGPLVLMEQTASSSTSTTTLSQVKPSTESSTTKPSSTTPNQPHSTSPNQPRSTSPTDRGSSTAHSNVVEELVNDLSQTSTATILQFTLSTLISILLALILH